MVSVTDWHRRDGKDRGKSFYCVKKYNKKKDYKLRKCLKCEKDFPSISTENRVCDYCKSSQSYSTECEEFDLYL